MRPNAYIFTGPTLAKSNLAPPEGIAFLPPAAQGDVYRAARDRPAAIGIIDGYFEGQASVWHKEILWAMDQGIHVFGSASMGALRAAELHVFGMQGIGRIFDAYRDGVYEDDDEVAVLHAPIDAGFLPLSEPMANIRATLQAAEHQGVIAEEPRQLLEQRAKSTFYQERRWESLLSTAEQEGVGGDTLRALSTWLTENRIDQKRLDAEEMIDAMAASLDKQLSPPATEYHFEWTEMWDEVVRRYEQTPSLHDRGNEAIQPAILDEVRLDASAADPIFRLALLRRLASPSLSEDISQRVASSVKVAFRERLGLFSRADLDQWIEQHHLDRESFEQLMIEEAALQNHLALDQDQLGKQLLDQLRLDGRYDAFAKRAKAKQACLDAIGKSDPGSEDVPLPPPALRAWFFEHQRREPIPTDIDDYARRIGFKNRESFDRALRLEYLYVISDHRVV